MLVGSQQEQTTFVASLLPAVAAALGAVTQGLTSLIGARSGVRREIVYDGAN